MSKDSISEDFEPQVDLIWERPTVSNQEHSPTPWHEADVPYWIHSAADHSVMKAMLIGKPDRREADTQFVLTAVNNHADLLKAVLAAADFFEHGSPKKFDTAQNLCRKVLIGIFMPKVQP